MSMNRRFFGRLLGGGLTPPVLMTRLLSAGPADPSPEEDVFTFLRRSAGRFDPTAYRRIVGAANPFKEGDEILGVAAANEEERLRARRLLTLTRVGDIRKNPLFSDALYSLLLENLPPEAERKTSAMTLGGLKSFLLSRSAEEILPLLDGLCSDAIGCLVKIMSNEELIAVGGKIFHPLPGTEIGARGYLGARIQPNSPTDHPDDVLWQIFSGWSFAVGDVVLGVNPVSSRSDSVAALEKMLADLRAAFHLEEVLPHSVLAHIDLQAEAEKAQPGTTGIWFQSLAGSVQANATFDLTVEKMLRYASQRTGQYGFYFETGQGADFTNGGGQGTDMVIHESRKYGFARLLKARVAEAQKKAGRRAEPWLHLNDVAGFIGPEVFRTREQLVRCCLEDVVMGKLHGLTIGLDICSTLHMDVSLDDLDWCQDQVMPARPAYLMALPTKNDPMLGYLTTAYQDHVRLRRKFGCRINDRMAAFFRELGILDRDGQPTPKFGQPLHVWLQYRRARGDGRSEAAILGEGRQKMAEVRGRGVYLAEGFDGQPDKMAPGLDREIRELYADAKKMIWVEFSADFLRSLPGAVILHSRSRDRRDYILHPQTGEEMHPDAWKSLRALQASRTEEPQVQVVVSDGLNANALMDSGHLAPYLAALEESLRRQGLRQAGKILVVCGGRVRAGYRLGEFLFGGLPEPGETRAIVHLIGERPGTMHHTFSAYITAARVATWKRAGIDHDVTRVVSGIADTALRPDLAAEETVKILAGLWDRKSG